MMEDRSFKYIGEEAQRIEIEPPVSGWHKLEAKLRPEKSVGKAWLPAIAAAFVLLIGALGFFQVNLHHIIIPDNYAVAEWEDLDQVRTTYYSSDQVHGLYAAYAK